MPLSTEEKLGGVIPYNIAADDGLTTAFPVPFGLLLCLDLALGISMLGLGTGTLRGAEITCSLDCADEACEGPPSLAKRFLRTYKHEER